jgi:pimeloyl-ACP methyl ester carboxylesterase
MPQPVSDRCLRLGQIEICPPLLLQRLDTHGARSVLAEQPVVTLLLVRGDDAFEDMVDVSEGQVEQALDDGYDRGHVIDVPVNLFQAGEEPAMSDPGRPGPLIEEGRLTDTIAALAKMNNTRKARQVSSPTPATCSAATASCSTTTSSGTWPTWKPSTPTKGPRRSRPSLSVSPSPERTGLRHVQVDGLRLRTCRAPASPLLILTGIGASLELTAPFERALHPYGMQTIAVDAPGTGDSAPYRRPRRMPGVARTTHLSSTSSETRRWTCSGVSFGGLLAQQLAHQAPQRIRRLVLAATAAGVPGLGGVPGPPRVLAALATPPLPLPRLLPPRRPRPVRRTSTQRPDALLHGSRSSTGASSPA